MSAPDPDEAREWLKGYGLAPDLTITWDVEPDPGAYHRLLEILFSPRSEDSAA